MVALFALTMIGLGSLSASGSTDVAPVLKAPPFTVDVRVTPQSELEFKARPPASHHFNIEAPISLTTKDGRSFAAVVKRENEILFHTPIPTPGADYTFSLYLCDDAKTFCEKHALTGRWAVPAAGSSSALAGDWSTLRAHARHRGRRDGRDTAGAPHEDEFGFIVNDADRALALAKARRQAAAHRLLRHLVPAVQRARRGGVRVSGVQESVSRLREAQARRRHDGLLGR